VKKPSQGCPVTEKKTFDYQGGGGKNEEDEKREKKPNFQMLLKSRMTTVVTEAPLRTAAYRYGSNPTFQGARRKIRAGGMAKDHLGERS